VHSFCVKMHRKSLGGRTPPVADDGLTTLHQTPYPDLRGRKWEREERVRKGGRDRPIVFLKVGVYMLSIDNHSLLDRSNPWPHVAIHHISISQLLSSCCYLFTVSNSGLLSVQRPRPASHAHFHHSHIPELICGVNSSIDSQYSIVKDLCMSPHGVARPPARPKLTKFGE